MTKSRIELKIVILISLAFIAVAATGYLAYTSISYILTTIKNEAQPNHSLLLIKDINSELLYGESNINYFLLTGNKDYSGICYQVMEETQEKVELLYTFRTSDKLRQQKVDSINILVDEKFEIWDKLLTYEPKDRVNKALSELSEVLNATTDTVSFQLSKNVKIEPDDSVPAEVQQPKAQKEEEKPGFFGRLFGKNSKAEPEPEKNKNSQPEVARKKTEVIDTVIALDSYKEKIQKEIGRLQAKEEQQQRQMTAYQVALRKQNDQITRKLALLIENFESAEIKAIEQKAETAKNLVTRTNKWSGVFLVMFSILLITILFVLQRYLRKAKQAQIALQQSKDAAIELGKAKEQFLANMSHEIRTPMNAIVGFTEQVLQNQLPKNVEEQLSVVKNSADHLLNLINDILDFSKLEAGKLDLSSDCCFNPREALNHAYQLFKPSAEKKSLAFNLNIDFEDIALIGDEFRLKQMIFNLVSNAVKFTQEGTIDICAKLIPENKEQAQLIIEIKDSGIGIPEDKLDHIFEEFSQAESSTSRSFGGTGLGLAIVKKLAELHQGSIKADNNPTKGATFTLTLPYKTGKLSDIPKKQQTITDIELDLSQHKILVVDDHPYNLMLISKILKKWNASFELSSDGKQALEILNVQSFDLTFLDLYMPNITGFQVLDEIKSKLSNKNKVVALTAASNLDEIKNNTSSVFDGYLQKPFTEKQLADCIIQQLDLKSQTKVDEENVSDSNEKFKELFAMAGNDDGFVKEMMEMFLVTSGEGLDFADKLFKEKDWQNFADQIHKIKSPCKHLGANALSVKLKELETLAREGKNEVKIDAKYRDSQHDFIQLMNEVSTFLSQRFSV